MFKYLFVGGHFGENPKPSGYISKLYDNIRAMNPNGQLINGGKFKELELMLGKLERTGDIYDSSKHDVIFWMPDIDNKRQKLVRKIKKIAPHTLLVTSKNNLDNKYPFMELVARALQVKSNLFVEFLYNRYLTNKIIASVCDPLGNQFIKSDSISKVAIVLMDRIQELLRYTRMGSYDYLEAGNLTMWGELEPNVPEEFYSLVKGYADVFHKCIHAVNQSRLLGNASFRCERGFPSFKDNEQVYVSQRNIDKRFIGPEGFIPVKLVFNNILTDDKKVMVGYHGEYKPSVDAPIQLLLYRYYHKMKYMIHSHTYIKHAPTTKKKIPCGAVEEFYEIIKLCPDREHSFIMVNLWGHGSLIMVENIENLRNIDYIPRNAPEI